MGKVIMSGVSKGMTTPSTLPPVGTALNDMSWGDIRRISDAGLASKYFSVGDTKEITLNGTLGNLTLSNYKVNAVIIGINHNSEHEGDNRIHFQIGKIADEKSISLVDSAYDSAVSAQNFFSMNASNTNSGGWESSQMRTNICNAMQGVVDYELQAVIKGCPKYTDNVAGGSDPVAGNVTGTYDAFFLLSEYEVFGTTSYSNANEANYQKQYEYYASGNTKVRYKHSSTTTASAWWLRSPYVPYINVFVRVNTDGTVNYNNAHGSSGFAPGFCV